MLGQIARAMWLLITKPYLIKAFCLSLQHDGVRKTLKKVSYKLSGFHLDFAGYRFQAQANQTDLPDRFMLGLLVEENPSQDGPLFSIHLYRVGGKGIHIYQDTVECGSQKLASTLNQLVSQDSSQFVLLGTRSGTDANLLSRIAEVVWQHPNAGEAFYFDSEVQFEGGKVIPHFRPQFSVEYLLAFDFVGNLLVFERSAYEAAGGLNPQRDGYSALTDLLLKIAKDQRSITHLTEIVHREIEGEILLGKPSEDSSLAARQEFLVDSNYPAVVRRTDSAAGIYSIEPSNSFDTKVSIIIPFKDGGKVLDDCFAAVLSKTTHPHFEILAVNNNSCQARTSEIIAKHTHDPRFRLLTFNQPFNFSAINNFAVTQARGDYVVLLNSDVEVLAPNWLETLLLFAIQPHIGAVGGLLFFPDMTIEHAGVVVGGQDVAFHSHRGLPVGVGGYFYRPYCLQEVTAVTAACLMIQKSKYEQVGGLDEQNLGVLFNDVDFCLRLKRTGYRNIYNPSCRAIHYESKTRGHDFSAERLVRRRAEAQLMFQRHAEFYSQGDPFYSPHLAPEGSRFSINRGSTYCDTQSTR